MTLTEIHPLRKRSIMVGKIGPYKKSGLSEMVSVKRTDGGRYVNLIALE